jgi:virginiamycin B lyase
LIATAVGAVVLTGAASANVRAREPRLAVKVYSDHRNAPWSNLVGGPDGNLWWAHGGKVVRMTPSGHLTTFPSGTGRSVGLHDMVAGPDGNLWLGATGTVDPIGRVTPTGLATWYSLSLGPSAGGGSATGVADAGLTAGPGGDVWFATFHPSSIGRIAPDGAVAEFRVSRPVGDIAAGPDGNVWFIGWKFGTFGPRRGPIRRMTPSGAVLPGGWPLPSDVQIGGSPRARFTAGPHRTMWLSGVRAGKGVLVRVSSTGRARVIPLGAGPREPVGMAKGADGNLWFVLDQGPFFWRVIPDRVGRVTPAGTVTLFRVRVTVYPGGGLAAGPGGRLWFATGAGRRIASFDPRTAPKHG